MLEVIDKGQVSEMHSYPLLFLHGAWHGAWCWDEHFLDFFATQGLSSPGSQLAGARVEPNRQINTDVFDRRFCQRYVFGHRFVAVASHPGGSFPGGLCHSEVSGDS